MNKNLVDLQRSSKATCVIVKTSEYKKLSSIVSMKASVSDNFLLSPDIPPFAEKINQKCKKNNLCYFVITEIDQVSTEQQERFVGLVKDREFNNYYLPDNCIIVFTVQDESTLKNISPKLYHFAVVAI